MRVLWIVNNLMPNLADYFGAARAASGTWLIDLADRISTIPGYKLAIACVYGSEFRRIDIEGITYYTLPGNGKDMLFYRKRFERLWRQIDFEFKPDIVHLHGTEYAHGLSYLNACNGAKTVVSIQGILNRIKDVDFGELPISVFILNRTLKQWLHFSGEIELHFLHKMNAKRECEILSRVDNINVVNAWDESLCKSINPDLKVYRLEYNLREEFYSSRKWDYEKIEKYTIFTNPGGTPLKGLHQLIKAISLVKRDYPNVKVYVPGMAGENGKLAVNSAYERYLSKLLSSTKTEENFIFLGRLTADGIREKMLKSNVVVIPSAIEGTSLILREAMFLGCPCIASFRGGMADFIQDKVDGYLYDFQEYPYLALRIKTLFQHRDICELFTKKAIIKATAAHDRNRNVEGYLRMYENIIGEDRLR